MRIVSCITLILSAALIAVAGQAAKEPAPLLKAVVPTNGLRVRIPVDEARGTTMQFKAQIPRKGKKGDMIDVTVGIETLPGPSYVSTKLWESWGYETPPNKMAILPELVIPASQVAPKLSKGQSRDVQVKIPGLVFEIVDPPQGAEKVRGVDLYLTLKELTKYRYADFEPRFYFQDKFIDLTVPAAATKRVGGGDEAPPEPAITAEPGLVPVAGPIVIRDQQGRPGPRGIPVFVYASVNGFTQYALADGKTELVNAGVSSTNDWPTGVLMTMATARGCKVEVNEDKDSLGMGANYQLKVVEGKIKEFRLGMLTGPNMKTQKDLVIKDLTVYVDKNNSSHFVWLGPRFLDTYFKDQVYNCTSDGVFALHGRVKPDLLLDINTRPKKP